MLFVILFGRVLAAGEQGDICGTGHPPCVDPLYCDIPYGQEYGTCENFCGDGYCDAWENSSSCSADCGCDTDGICESSRNETVANCPSDCGCNLNQICESSRGERRGNCTDCPTPPPSTCGNGVLDAGEACDGEIQGSTCDPTWANWACYSCQVCEEIPTCGNGVIETVLGEPCDTASSSVNQGCAEGFMCIDRSYRGAGCVCQTPPPVDDMTCEISLTDCQQPCYTNGKPFDVFFVMDVSYSMVLGHKLNIMKTSFNAIIDALPTGSRVSVIQFDSEAMLYQSLTLDLAQVRSREPYPREETLTNYIDTFTVLEDEITRHQASFSGRNQLVYFFSDGEPTIGGPFQYVIPQANNDCYIRGTVRGESGYICDVGCALANNSCQFDAANAMADYFHERFPTLSTIAIGLDVQPQHHYILADHVATPGLFSAISSATVAPGAWGITGFCNKLDTLSAHPLTHFVDQFCEMSCEPPLCKVYTGTYTSQPATSTPTGCLTGTYTDLPDSATTWQWQCTGTDGTTQLCGATKISTPSGPMCSELTVTLLTGMTYQFACTGSGTTYQIQIKNAQGAIISVLSGATGSYTFATSGTYTATCYVDGVTGELCPDDPGYDGTTISPTSHASALFPTSSSSFGTASSGVEQPAMGDNYFQRSTTTATIKQVLSKVDTSTLSVASKPSSVFFSPFQTILQQQLTSFQPCYNPCEKIIIVTPPIPEQFDLALRKTLLQPQTAYVSGDEVTFQIELLNQGTLPAKGVVVVDYAPDGLTLHDSARTYEPGKKQAYYTYSSVLSPGEIGIIPITFHVNGTVVGTITNRAEIMEDNNTDIDSTPNNDQTDDCFGGDDIVTGNGSQATSAICTPETDEDDHDPASLTVTTAVVPSSGTFDLRIKKDVSVGPYSSGQIITYTVTVLNTGDTVASGFVIDTLPVGLSYVGGFTATPTTALTALGTGTWQLHTLQPGESVTFSYTVRIGALLGPAKNIISVIASATGETIPYKTGSCLPGHNPLINDNAVLGTNNTDCEEILIGGACTASLEPVQSVIRARSHTTLVHCNVSGMSGIIGVDCGNGTTGTMQNATSAQCVYNGYGTYAPTCTRDGQKVPGCATSLILRSGGGGDPSSICLSLTPALTTIQSRKHDVDVRCNVKNAGSSSISVDCGNGTQKPGTEATCELRGYGDYTIHCLVDGKPADKCSTTISLKGTGPSSSCGDGKVDAGEQCDPGTDAKGKKNTLCTDACTWKFLDPDGPACAFVDPPSIQMGELLPFWRDLDDERGVTTKRACTAAHLGAIDPSTMMCHFSVIAPGGKKYFYTELCKTDNLKHVGRYKDLQKDLKTKLMPRRGQSYLDSSERKTSGYGEYALVLDKITYDICTQIGTGGEILGEAPVANEDETSYEFVSETYDGRVCQYNFAVTTPYMMQKGSSLSSFEDDRTVLQEFHLLGGQSILNQSDVQRIKFLEKTSTTNAFDQIKENTYEEIRTVINPIEPTHPLARFADGILKAPNKELYLVRSDMLIDYTLSSPLNSGKPTTIVAQGPHTVTIEGSLPANLMLVVPEGTVVFENIDCDANDSVSGIIIAKYLKTRSTRSPLANTTVHIRNKEWCSGGQLIIKGLLVTSSADALYEIRNARRSVLQRWFDATASKKQHIYDGASLRIDTDAALRSALPPLAQQTQLVFKLQAKGTALAMPLYLDPESLPFYISLMASAGLIIEVK